MTTHATQTPDTVILRKYHGMRRWLYSAFLGEQFLSGDTIEARTERKAIQEAQKLFPAMGNVERLTPSGKVLPKFMFRLS